MMFQTAVIKDEHTDNEWLQSDSSFLLRNSMKANTTSSEIEIQLYACNSHCSVRLIICDTALNISAIIHFTRRHCSSLEIENNNA